jgi:predicted MFS family arabinose efflux permease
MTSAATAATAPAIPAPSLWSPLAIRAFRMLWQALLVASISQGLFQTASGWVMTSLSSSPVLISLVQTAALLPGLLFALPSGALADTLNRRSIMLRVEGTLAVANIALAALSYSGLLDGPLLLLFVLVNGTALALGGPAWQTALIETAPAEQRSSVVLLGGVAVSISRGVGPLLAGLVLSAAGGSTLSFALSAVGFSIAFLLVRASPAKASAAARLSAERVFAAILAGIRFARNEPAMQVALRRVFVFMLAGTAYWAVVPLVGRRVIGFDALGFGLWMMIFGLGSVFGAYLMSRILTVLGLNTIVAISTVTVAVGMATISLVPTPYVAYPVMFAIGMAWTMAIGAFVTTVQSNVPSWVRSRAMAIYGMAFEGTIALAAAVWGVVAEHLGVRTELLVGAAALLVTLSAGLWWRLSLGDSATLLPYGQFPELQWSSALDSERARALVMFEYTISEADRAKFIGLMDAVGLVRRRNGVTEWGLYQDIIEADRWIEEFIVDSLDEMENIRQRTTVADFAALQEAYALHKGDTPTPTIRRLIAPATSA